MKRLLIRSCLIAGLVCAASCASNKETAVQEPAAAPVMQPEQTAAAARPAPPSPVPLTTSLLPEKRMKAISPDRPCSPAISARDCARPNCRIPCCTTWTAS